MFAILVTVTLSSTKGQCCEPSAGCIHPQRCLDPVTQPFCTASKANCEKKCKHVWCDSGGGMGHNFTIDASKVLHNATSRFVSFTFDLSAWAVFAETRNFTDPAFITAAQALAPALLRIGGTAEDNTTYAMSGSATAGFGRSIPGRTLTRAQWDGINAFAVAAGWQIVFGLNALKGWGGEGGWAWDSDNARELVEYSVKKKFPVVGWELGNEPDLNNKGGAVQTGAGVASRFGTLLKLLHSVYSGELGGGTPASPWVIGPDVTKGGVLKGFLGNFLAAFDPASALNVVTWHHYYTSGSNGVVMTSEYLDPKFLDTYVDAAKEASASTQKFRSTRGADPMLWMGETSGAGGATTGAHLVIGRFLGVFWYADKLGAAAITGHSVVMKQQYQYEAFAATSDGSGVTASPEYWISLLWKRHMGPGALPVTGGGGLVRVYASLDSSGVVAAVVINLGLNLTQVQVAIIAAAADIKGTPAEQHDRYTLTAWPDPSDMQSNATAINGKEVRLGVDGSPPAFDPVRANGSLVSAPARSVSFLVFQ